jgi:hypothetical protein
VETQTGGKVNEKVKSFKSISMPKKCPINNLIPFTNIYVKREICLEHLVLLTAAACMPEWPSIYIMGV